MDLYFTPTPFLASHLHSFGGLYPYVGGHVSLLLIIFFTFVWWG